MKNLNEQLELNNELINSLLEENQAILDEAKSMPVYARYARSKASKAGRYVGDKVSGAGNYVGNKASNIYNPMHDKLSEKYKDKLGGQRPGGWSAAHEKADKLATGTFIVGGVVVAGALAAGITALVRRFKSKKAAAANGNPSAQKEALKAKVKMLEGIKDAGEKTNKAFEKVGKQERADRNQKNIDDIQERINKTKSKLKQM